MDNESSGCLKYIIVGLLIIAFVAGAIWCCKGGGSKSYKSGSSCHVCHGSGYVVKLNGSHEMCLNCSGTGKEH